MTSLPPQEEYRTLVKRINSSNYLLNKQLQHVCSLNGLRSSGVKAELQRRLIDALNTAYAAGDVRTFREIEQSIYREKQGVSNAVRGFSAAQQPHVHDAHLPGLHTPTNLPQSSNMPGNYSGYQQPNGHNGFGGYGGTNGHRPQPVTSSGPYFNSSPFYTIMERLGNVHICEVMAQHRSSLSIGIQAQDNPLLQQCVTDKSLRVMVFCAGANFGSQDITFPHQSELKVNGDDIKANLRGLKNKPGSTRPVDITDLLRLRLPAYPNTVEFTYALTQKRFYLAIYICRSIPVEGLVHHITSQKISKDSVVKELTRKAHDAEIELSSQVLSLKCPLSYMRLVTPIRATTCTHVQCFDADSYLQLQQQGPQWVCPVCSKPAPFNRLAVDEYVRDILDNTPKSVDQVDIEPNGQWKIHGAVKDEVKPRAQFDAFELDDDDLAISEVDLVGAGGTTSPNTVAPTAGARTPASGVSREGSSMPRPGGTKRSHEVIDLTLSDDEDEEPPQPPPKRQQFHRPVPGMPPYF